MFSSLESTEKINLSTLKKLIDINYLKLMGEFKREGISLLLKEFLMYNPHIKEYFEDRI